MSNHPIARREFTVGSQGGCPLELLVYAPVQGDQDFRCRYELLENGKLITSREIFGIDSLQALILALRMSGLDALLSAPGVRRDLYWYGENDDPGLLLPNNIEVQALTPVPPAAPPGPRSSAGTVGIAEMAPTKYSHLVEYDEAANKIVISRVSAAGNSHQFTELPISDLPQSKRTFETVSQMLGEALVLDMRKLCDDVLP